MCFAFQEYEMLAGKKLRQCIAMNMIWNLLKHRNSWTFADNIFYISIRLLCVFILEMVRFDKRYLGASWGLTADTLEPTARHACQHNTTDTTQHNTHNATDKIQYNRTDTLEPAEARHACQHWNVSSKFYRRFQFHPHS